MRITVISDTHNKHRNITQDLPGGDLLLHAGDLSSMGKLHEIADFCHWFDGIENYKRKIFIAGNHDWGFQQDPQKVGDLVKGYKSIEYVQDVSVEHDGVTIFGSPWQPEFCNWAFNLPRNGDQLHKKWEAIPNEIDIVITHTPVFGRLDDVDGRRGVHLGCEALCERIEAVKPKIHVCGHIHSGYGYAFDRYTHYFNAAVLDERYSYSQLPMTFDWNREKNEIKFVDTPLIF